MSRSVALPFGLSSDLAGGNGQIRHPANRQLHSNRQRMTTGLRLSQCEAANIGGFGQYPISATNRSECQRPVDGVLIALPCPGEWLAPFIGVFALRLPALSLCQGPPFHTSDKYGLRCGRPPQWRSRPGLTRRQV